MQDRRALRWRGGPRRAELIPLRQGPDAMRSCGGGSGLSSGSEVNTPGLPAGCSQGTSRCLQTASPPAPSHPNRCPWTLTRLSGIEAHTQPSRLCTRIMAAARAAPPPSLPPLDHDASPQVLVHGPSLFGLLTSLSQEDNWSSGPCPARKPPSGRASPAAANARRQDVPSAPAVVSPRIGAYSLRCGFGTLYGRAKTPWPGPPDAGGGGR